MSEPPWKRKTRRGVFEGDVAVVELRSRLALGPERIPEPTGPTANTPAFGGTLRLLGGVLTAAAVAGVAGYLWGVRLSSRPPQLASASDQADVRPALSTAPASLKAPPPNAERPPGLSTKSPPHASASNQANAAPAPPSPPANAKAPSADSGRPAGPAAAISSLPADARGSANDVTPVDTIRRPVPPARPVSPSSASRPPSSADDASEIAAKMKMGTELMANGDVAAARLMFERAAEAGDAAGAFALAETYDPVVLRRLHLRGGVVPDVALARKWYETARDLGSVAAPERLSRLAQLPQ